MKHKLEKIVVSFLLTSLLIPSLAVNAQVFSIDDNTAIPVTWPFPAPLPGAPFGVGYGYGAEDPFGTVFGPLGLAPSPSLLSSGVIDGDILMSSGGGGPVVNTPAPFDAFYGTGFPHGAVNALSNNSVPSLPLGASYNLLISVDRRSFGGAASASAIEAGLNQQPGDIYVSTIPFLDPATFVGALPPGVGYVGPIGPLLGGSNALLFDESSFDLQVGLGPAPAGLLPPGILAPPITGPPVPGQPGSHDNLDAFELRLIDVTGDNIEDIDYFSSIYADQALSAQFATGGIPFDSADIWYTPAGAAGASTIYAPAVALGLIPFPPFPQQLPLLDGNDLDAMVVWDVAGDGIATPVADYALFSLAPGSIDLVINGLTPDDIFFTDFSGSYGLFASANDVGLTGQDNVDALEVVLTGDANLDGKVDFLDFSALSGSYTLTGTNWFTGDFNGDGKTDFLDFSALSANYTAMTGAIQIVPEPISMVILAIGLLGFCATGRGKRPA